jgi:hypothetical protein
MAQKEECLLRKCEVLSSIPSTTKIIIDRLGFIKIKVLIFKKTQGLGM